MGTANSGKYSILIFLFLLLFNISAKAQDICVINVEALPLKMADKAPIYPGCEDVDSKEDVINCMDEKIRSFFEENLQVPKASRDRYIIQLKIDENGCISNIRVNAKDPAIEKEAIRVSSLLPQMKAGMHKGEYVDVMYSLIITPDE